MRNGWACVQIKGWEFRETVGVDMWRAQVKRINGVKTDRRNQANSSKLQKVVKTDWVFKTSIRIRSFQNWA